MEHLWNTAEGEAKAVHTALGRHRGITLNTIQSTLKRLFEKGLLSRLCITLAHDAGEHTHPRLSMQPMRMFRFVKYVLPEVPALLPMLGDHNFDTIIEAQGLAEHIDRKAASGPDATNELMPIGDPTPTLDERQQLSEWIACGAP
jgi:hypothetical protein